MATNKFKDVSPYVHINERHHHDTDWKHVNYLKGLSINQDVSGDDGVDQPPVSLGLFGLGRAGTIHLNNILANRKFELKYIVEDDDFKWKSVTKKLNLKGITFLRSSEAQTLYDDKDLEAVIVATPTNSHEDYIANSLQSGKAVFTEKPVAEESEAVDRVYKIAKEVSKPLFCAFNRRFDPSFDAVYRQVRAGQLGQVHQIKLTSRDSPLPSEAYLKISGGIFHDCMVHDIDLMTYVLGEYPVEVFTVANGQIPEIAAMNDYDNVVSTFKFKSGTIGMVDLSRWASYGYDQRLEVFGPKGMLQVANDRPNCSEHTTNQGVSKVPMYWSFPSRHSQGYVNELEHFFQVVRGHSKSSVSHEMTMAITKIANAAEASANSGQPVSLSWTKEEIPDGYIMDI